jgi:integrase
VAELVEVYKQRHLGKRKPSTRREYERLLEKVVLPAFGRRRLDEVTASEVAAWHAKQPSPYAANRALALVRSLFELAAKWQLRDPSQPNPAAYVERNREQGRERFLDADELARFGTALAAVEADEPRSRIAVAALRLLLLTGARRNEVLTLRWEILDREKGCAWLADSKTGRRPLLLATPAWDVIDGLAAQYDLKPRKGWLLPSYRKHGSHLTDLRKTFAEVCKRANLEGLRLHDLRHSHASAAAGEGLSLPLIGKLLGHKRASTTERYAHLADDPARKAADLVQRRLADDLSRKPAQVDVTKLRP